MAAGGGSQQVESLKQRGTRGCTPPYRGVVDFVPVATVIGAVDWLAAPARQRLLHEALLDRIDLSCRSPVALGATAAQGCIDAHPESWYRQIGDIVGLAALLRAGEPGRDGRKG